MQLFFTLNLTRALPSNSLQPRNSPNSSKCVSMPFIPGTEHASLALRKVVHLFTSILCPPMSFWEEARKSFSEPGYTLLNCAFTQHDSVHPPSGSAQRTRPQTNPSSICVQKLKTNPSSQCFVWKQRLGPSDDTLPDHSRAEALQANDFD